LTVQQYSGYCSQQEDKRSNQLEVIVRYFCPGCGTKYNKPDKEIPDEGMSVSCEKCNFNITIKPPKRRTSTKPSAPPPESAKTDVMPAAQEPSQTEAADDWPVDENSAVEEPAAQTAVAPVAKDAPEEKAGTDTKEPQAEKPQPKPQPEKKKKKKKPAGKKTPGRYLESIGTGKSGDKFRFRDLFYALAVPLDYRKVIVVGLAVFVGSLLFAGLSYLGFLTKSTAGMIIGSVLGGLVFWAITILGMAVTSYQTDREMEAGRHLPISEGIRFVTSRPLAVLGTPFTFVIGILLMGAGIAVFSAIGRIPYAGPLIYGLTFSVTFTLALIAVLLSVIFVVTTFSYVPAIAREKLGPYSGAKRAVALVRQNLARYVLHILIAAVCVYILIILLNMLVVSAMWGLGWVGGKAMGPDLTSVLLEIPYRLFSILVIIVPDPILSMFQAAAGQGWQFTIAGWLVGVVMLAVFSGVMAFVLTYFGAAGVVNYHLLTQKKDLKD
jgi:DNA-directed RNA polymerase subunit RPC12/RpoP/MFS family permease